ncbi:MAG: VOC family protein [Saprospiraceae bacterium]
MIQSYLTFNGNCREAMTFYQTCLGGELVLQKIGDSPLSEQMPQEMKDCILHATLSDGPRILMGSDMVSQRGLLRGNNVSLSLVCRSEEEIREKYQKLATGGSEDHPIENSFWGALFGDLTDKYGNHWLLSFEQKQAASSH